MTDGQLWALLPVASISVASVLCLLADAAQAALVEARRRRAALARMRTTVLGQLGDVEQERAS